MRAGSRGVGVGDLLEHVSDDVALECKEVDREAIQRARRDLHEMTRLDGHHRRLAAHLHHERAFAEGDALAQDNAQPCLRSHLREGGGEAVSSSHVHRDVLELRATPSSWSTPAQHP